MCFITDVLGIFWDGTLTVVKRAGYVEIRLYQAHCKTPEDAVCELH